MFLLFSTFFLSRSGLCRLNTVLLLALLSGCAALPASDIAAPAAPSPSLRNEFRRAYDGAIEQHRAAVILASPVVIQDFLGMTLITSDGQRLRYEIDKTVYFALANNSHPPYGIYSIIAMQGYGELSAAQQAQLADYRAAILASLEGLSDIGLSAVVEQRLLTILERSRDFIDTISAAGTVSEAEFLAFVTPLRPLFSANFQLAALEQLRQFRAQMQRYKADFPDQDWQKLRVVVMGFHQPRQLWTPKQFFQWLLREPDYEHRVVYAEFQHPFFGTRRAEAEDKALELLTKVDFDQSAAEVFLGDRTGLGSDVLGGYAKDIIKSWGPSTFLD